MIVWIRLSPLTLPYCLVFNAHINLAAKAEQCLLWLQACHEKHVHNDQHFNPCPKVAKLFAQAAANKLTDEQFEQLVRFLKDPRAAGGGGPQLNETLTERLERSYAEEVGLSGASRERLAAPGGPADASLGIILHTQTKDGLLVLGSWWDLESKTIKLLVEKGMKEEFTSGFDWHWRAEETFGGNCHTCQWDKKLRSLHDQLSADLLEILPLPFVVTGSACTRKSLKKTLRAETASLRIDLGMPEAALDFDLDFQEDGLRRIIVHVPHPTGGFYQVDDKKTGLALQPDGGIDFFLWLARREWAPDTFSRHYTGRTSRNALLGELWAYIRREKIERRIFRLDEYGNEFLGWARRYLRKDPAVVLASGDSIATAASSLIRQKISNSHLELQRKKRKEKAAIDFKKTDLDLALGLQTFHGGTITVRKVGQILVDGSPLSFAIERDKARKILDLRGVSRIRFSLDNIELSVDDTVVYKKHIPRLISSTSGMAWLAQITYELEILGATTESSLPSANSAGPIINQLVPAPRTGPVGGRWINAEVRKRLLGGDLFHCVQSNTHHLHQKVYVRGISFPVPKEADAKTIFIKCFLTDEGMEHPDQCVKAGSQVDDPARRLGFLHLLVQYPYLYIVNTISFQFDQFYGKAISPTILAIKSRCKSKH